MINNSFVMELSQIKILLINFVI